MSLDAVFDRIDLAAEPFALCRLSGLCRLPVPRGEGATLHYILAGSGRISFRDRPALDVGPGALVLAPAHLSHALVGSGAAGPPTPDCRPAALSLAVHEVSGAGAGGELLALCAHVSVGLGGGAGLIGLLREPVAAEAGPGSPLGDAMSRLLAELSAPAPGARAMIRAILLQCVIHLLRGRLAAADPAFVWLRAAADPRLWPTLRAMLDAPGGPHSVESLAETAGLSRSVFAARFSAVFGKGPIELLRALRMGQAARMLALGEAPVKRVAALSGFSSRAAFARAFHAHFGLSPRAYRARERG